MAIAEKIIFNLLAFTLFTVVFMKMIKKNDTSYVYILILEFIGIAINFIELFISIKLNAFFETIMYLFSVFIPALVLIIEKEKKIDFPEMYKLLMAKIYKDSGKYDKAKDYLFSLINKYPESYLGHKALAKLYEKEGKNENAIDEYIRVTQINNKDLKINYNIANLLNFSSYFFRHFSIIVFASSFPSILSTVVVFPSSCLYTSKKCFISSEICLGSSDISL